MIKDESSVRYNILIDIKAAYDCLSLLPELSLLYLNAHLSVAGEPRKHQYYNWSVVHYVIIWKHKNPCANYSLAEQLIVCGGICGMPLSISLPLHDCDRGSRMQSLNAALPGSRNVGVSKDGDTS